MSTLRLLSLSFNRALQRLTRSNVHLLLVASLIAGGLSVAPNQAHAWSLFGGGSKTYAKTKNPIVLVGGFFAFDSIIGIEMFFGIEKHLEKYGATVYNTNVSAFQSDEFRGEELILQIEEILAVSGAKKVNILAHSQGSPTSRYVAAVRPDLIASVTSIHGMNRGTDIADVIRNIAPEDGITEKLLEGLAQGIGYIVEFLSGGPNPSEQTAIAILKAAHTEGAAEFNALYPAAVPTSSCGRYGSPKVNGVNYYSWGGIGGRFYTLSNPLDLLDQAMFHITPLMFKKGTKHDGVVPLCGQYLGKPIRHNYRHNHVDAVRHLFGLIGLTTDPKVLYRNHANRLKKAGL
ncbi:lipase [Gammaproteobacteria bacterium 45_16_T64]|nr:lipase [Gammaproteobacteria bacterium 45_16_T64]